MDKVAPLKFGLEIPFPRENELNMYTTQKQWNEDDYLQMIKSMFYLIPNFILT